MFSILLLLPYHTERCLGSNQKFLVLPMLCDVVANLLMRRLVDRDGTPSRDAQNGCLRRSRWKTWPARAVQLMRLSNPSIARLPHLALPLEAHLEYLSETSPNRRH